jgi:alanine dehydrogenase
LGMAIFITSQDVCKLLEIEDYIVIMEMAYTQFGNGGSNMLPRIQVDSGQRSSFMKILPASLSETGMAGIHVYTGGRGDFLKSIYLYDLQSGNLEAVIESDRIAWLVPGAVSAVATKFLAQKDARVMGLFGSGRQARAQLLAISKVRNLELVRAYSPQQEHRELFCEEMTKALKLPVVSAAFPEEALEGAQIVSAATSTLTPVFDGSKVNPGTHINAIGAHDPKRREVDGICVQRSKVIVDSLERALLEEGALILAAGEELIKLPHAYGELGEIVTGKKPGRLSNEEITLFLSGATAIEYVAIGAEILRRAKEKGMGQQLTMLRDESVPKSLKTKRI